MSGAGGSGSSKDELAAAVRDFCSRFGEDYWREADETRAFPEEFATARLGTSSVVLIDR